MTNYGKELVKRFLNKCKESGSYNKVFVDFEDGTCLLENDVETLEEVAAHYLVTYDVWAYNTLCEQVDFCNGKWNEICWNVGNKKYTFEEVKTILEKCL